MFPEINWPTRNRQKKRRSSQQSKLSWRIGTRDFHQMQRILRQQKSRFKSLQGLLRGRRIRLSKRQGLKIKLLLRAEVQMSHRSPNLRLATRPTRRLKLSVQLKESFTRSLYSRCHRRPLHNWASTLTFLTSRKAKLLRRYSSRGCFHRSWKNWGRKRQKYSLHLGNLTLRSWESLLKRQI